MSTGDTITRTFDLPSPAPPSGEHSADARQARTARNSRRVQAAVAGVLAVLIALAGSRLWFVDGIWRRASIDGPSMAPALCGASYLVTCNDCAFPFSCDAEHVPADRRAACPNCGHARNDLAAARQLPPQRVIVDRWPLLLRSPRRGEVVACTVPGRPGELAVKRVAGIAGEQLAIRGGDLYADGKLIRKSPAELHAVRVLVHDNEYQPRLPADLPQRWRGTTEKSRWQQNEDGFQRAAGERERADWDWIEYQHWAGTANERLRGISTAMRDNDSYNQGPGARPLNPVSDAMLSCRVQAAGEGELAFAAADGEQRFAVVIEPARRVLVQVDGQQLLEVPFEQGLAGDAIDIEFGLCDRQVLFIAQGRTIVRLPYERPAEGPPGTLHPLAIGVRGLTATVSQLRVWRDAFYLDPRGLARPWEMPAAPASAGFSLLGDNSPVSIDSRQWEPARVPASAIRGIVYRAFWTL